jgi:hypothetical protein
VTWCTYLPTWVVVLRPGAKPAAHGGLNPRKAYPIDSRGISYYNGINITCISGHDALIKNLQSGELERASKREWKLRYSLCTFRPFKARCTSVYQKEISPRLKTGLIGSILRAIQKLRVDSRLIGHCRIGFQVSIRIIDRRRLGQC